MPSLWFVMPVHGRAKLAAICMRQLRRTCDSLTEIGIDATAVVVGDDENLHTARVLGFGTVVEDNRFLSRKFNAGIQFALDPAFNPRPADYVIPIGSDDWIDWRLLLDLPGPGEMLGFQRLSFVREDGREITSSVLGYVGGCGIRVYPRELMASVGFRPAEEDRERACDTSILVNVRNANPSLRIWHGAGDCRQIVDWKTPGEQLNTYQDVGHYARERGADPFTALADVFPAESLAEMAAHYDLDRELAAA